jgi:ABC-type phosphate transport system substrate-binding protein
MKLLSARRLVPAGIISGAAMAALIVPGAASASLGEQCSGAPTITGQGSSLQALAQQTVWDSGFNISTSKAACSGKQGSGAKPTVKYTSSSSGAGLESWGADGKTATGFGVTNAFVGTDEAPNPNEKKEIEEEATGAVSESVASIPVLQAAVAIVVHLPANCKATSGKNPGRLDLDNVTLEGIYKGTITKWSQIKDDGDALSTINTGEPACDPTTTITPIVRKDSSGTTHILKRYLDLINGKAFETEKGESKTWNEIAEGTESTTWPKAANVKLANATGGGGMAQTVEEIKSSIGYLNLADARLKGDFVPTTPPPSKGGPGTSTFWAPLQDNGLVTTKEKYADPASNKDVAELGEANCKTTEYTNGTEAFPPKTVLENWNEVTTRTTEKKYPLCNLTYDLALTSFSAFPSTTLGEATDVHDFISFVVNSAGNGGQKELAHRDYLALPKGAVLTEAQKGAEKIGF